MVQLQRRLRVNKIVHVAPGIPGVGGCQVAVGLVATGLRVGVGLFLGGWAVLAVAKGAFTGLQGQLGGSGQERFPKWGSGFHDAKRGKKVKRAPRKVQRAKCYQQPRRVDSTLPANSVFSGQHQYWDGAFLNESDRLALVKQVAQHAMVPGHDDDHIGL